MAGNRGEMLRLGLEAPGGLATPEEQEGQNMPYWRLFYHFVWATKNREPLLRAELRPSLHAYIASKGNELRAIVHAVGGTEDHVHVAVSVPPSISVSEFVGRLKGSSSRLANLEWFEGAFAWQREYGVVSFGERHLSFVVAYVHKQEQRHVARDLIPLLERIGG